MTNIWDAGLNQIGLLMFVLVMVIYTAPITVAFWKGTSAYRYATIPLTGASFYSSAVIDGSVGLLIWLLAWLCAILAIRPTSAP